MTCVEVSIEPDSGELVKDAVASIASAIRDVGTGSTHSPGGLEAVAMAIGGAGEWNDAKCLTASIDGVASALDRIADALESLAESKSVP